MREVIDAMRLLAAMDERRADIAAGAWTQPIPAPLEAIAELTAEETSIFDVSGSTATAAAVRERHPDARIDADEERPHDAALIGTSLARTDRPGALLQRTYEALKPGGRALVLVPNRRSLFLIAGLAKNRPFTLPGAWPESGVGAVTLADVNALLHLTGFVEVEACVRIGEAIPAGVVFPVQIAYDGVSIDVRNAADLRDFLTIAYVVAARRPSAASG